MNFDATATLIVLIGCFSVLLLTKIAAEIVLWSGVLILMLLGVITHQEVLGSFSHVALATVCLLFVISGAVSRTGAIRGLFDVILGKPKSRIVAQLRLMSGVSIMSGVLNNTPVVAMLIPLVRRFSQLVSISASQLMIPLSFAAMVGGLCTAIGTSANLIVYEMLRAEGVALHIFEIALFGIPCVVVTIIFVSLTSRWLLPNPKTMEQVFDEAHEYTFEMLVVARGALVGKSLVEAGLCHLNEAFIIEIVRQDRSISAPGRDEVLQPKDRLIFTGSVDALVDVQNTKGLQRVSQQVFDLQHNQPGRVFVEVVIGKRFPHINKSIRECQFRDIYDAAVVAICRDGERIAGGVGDIVFQVGDVLLLEINNDTVKNLESTRDFLLVSRLTHSQPPLYHLRHQVLFILAIMLILVATGVVSMFYAALLAVISFVLIRVTNVRMAQESIEWGVVFSIAASIVMGHAWIKTGLADFLASSMMDVFYGSSMGILLGIFIITAISTAFINNVAAATLMFPIAVSVSETFGIALTPLAITIMIAASASFMTPIGYQTNLMVYGPGNYRYKDFIIIGLPLTVLIGMLTMLLVPFIWPI